MVVRRPTHQGKRPVSHTSRPTADFLPVLALACLLPGEVKPDMYIDWSLVSLFPLSVFLFFLFGVNLPATHDRKIQGEVWPGVMPSPGLGSGSCSLRDARAGLPARHGLHVPPRRLARATTLSYL